MFSIKDGLDPTTKTGRLLMGLLSLIAKMKWETIREATNENRMEKWKDGRTFIAHANGYFWNKKDNHLEINGDKVEFYHRVINMYSNLGMNYMDYAVRLKNEGRGNS